MHTHQEEPTTIHHMFTFAPSSLSRISKNHYKKDKLLSFPQPLTCTTSRPHRADTLKTTGTEWTFEPVTFKTGPKGEASREPYHPHNSSTEAVNSQELLIQQRKIQATGYASHWVLSSNGSNHATNSKPRKKRASPRTKRTTTSTSTSTPCNTQLQNQEEAIAAMHLALQRFNQERLTEPQQQPTVRSYSRPYRASISIQELLN